MTNKNNFSSRTSLTVSTADTRLFVRLSQDHEWRKLSPVAIREVIVKKLHILPKLIGKIKPVHPGLALSPCNLEAREEILKAGNGLFLSGAKLEAATNWISVLIPTVPAFVHMEHGKVEVSKSMLSDEIERVCSERPAHLKLYGQNDSEAPHRTWMAFFTKAPRAGFRVFDESGIVRPYKKQQPLEFCKRCNGHHPSRNCSRAPSCANCGSTNHSVDTCMAATKCRNCGRPHRADSRRCLARPTRAGVPTKDQMKTYRQAGEREYQAVQRARVAEEKAATTDKIEIDLVSNQIRGGIDTPENSQAAPAEDSTAVANRS
ncbi:putative eka-like protein [Erysiphe necator]|uniref:Putative eka-like protein n=1 Tax=Uncinula necator TaxID=52586 RepID=A0A0B1NWJ0_UNCNE|nr:putative eka-like protein [Erysiphe necator]